MLILAIIFTNNRKICNITTNWIDITTDTDKNCNLNSNCNSNSKYNCNSYCNCYYYCCNINKNNENLYLLNKTFHTRNFYNVLYTYNYKIYKYYNNYKIKIIQNSARLNRLYHTHCRAINRIGPHNLDVISIIFGLLLGAGTAQNISGEGVRISIKKSFIHKEFLFYLYEFFLKRGYCSNIKPRKFSRFIKNINKRYDGFEFNTYTFRNLVWIYKSFYKKGKKIIPLNIEKFITPLTLAIWISDAGDWTGSGVRIFCNTLTLREINFLLDILRKKFNLNCSIKKIFFKNKYSNYIFIKENSISNLRDFILPHIHNSMYYKLGLVKNFI